MARAWKTRRLAAAKADLSTASTEAKGNEALLAEAVRRYGAQTNAINETFDGLKAFYDAHKPTAEVIDLQELVLQGTANGIVRNDENRIACMKEASLLTDPEAAKRKRAECEEEFQMYKKLRDEGWQNKAELIESYASDAR